jgi:hypothetical protein
MVVRKNASAERYWEIEKESCDDFKALLRSFYKKVREELERRDSEEGRPQKKSRHSQDEVLTVRAAIINRCLTSVPGSLDDLKLNVFPRRRQFQETRSEENWNSYASNRDRWVEENGIPAPWFVEDIDRIVEGWPESGKLEPFVSSFGKSAIPFSAKEAVLDSSHQRWNPLMDNSFDALEAYSNSFLDALVPFLVRQAELVHQNGIVKAVEHKPGKLDERVEWFVKRVVEGKSATDIAQENSLKSATGKYPGVSFINKQIKWIAEIIDFELPRSQGRPPKKK